MSYIRLFVRASAYLKILMEKTKKMHKGHLRKALPCVLAHSLINF